MISKRFKGGKLISLYTRKNLARDNVEIAIYDDAYREYHSIKEILTSTKLTKPQRSKYEHKLRCSEAKLKEYKDKFSYFEDLTKNEKAIAKEGKADGENQLALIIAANNTAAKERKEKYYVLTLNTYRRDVRYYTALVGHPFFTIEKEELVPKKQVVVLKKDYKAIAREAAGVSTDRKSLATLPKNLEFITKDMVPTLARRIVKDDIKDTLG
jgi:hypothetical protein